jgi:ABC-type iron transport system FetAB permease component
MNSVVTTIPLSHLGVMLMPVLLVLGIQYFWTVKNGPSKAGESLVAMFRMLIPLAGMTASNAMNTLSLTIERFDHERRSNNYTVSRNAAFQTAMIPQVNAFMAVGLISLPGMMTGQVLAGIDPTIAARYQIVVMCLIFGASGIAAACYLRLNGFIDPDTQA